jgi:hypothetical protein
MREKRMHSAAKIWASYLDTEHANVDGKTGTNPNSFCMTNPVSVHAMDAKRIYKHAVLSIEASGEYELWKIIEGQNLWI